MKKSTSVFSCAYTEVTDSYVVIKVVIICRITEVGKYSYTRIPSISNVVAGVPVL